MYRQTLRFTLFGFLLMTMLIALLTGCTGVTAAGQTQPQATATTPPDTKLLLSGGAALAHPYPFADVSFTGLTFSHAASIVAITDLGLMLHAPCTLPGAPWQSPETTNVPVSSQTLPDLWVAGPVVQFPENYSPGDPLAPHDWLQRLAASPVVNFVRDGNLFCPNIIEGSTPGAGAYFNPFVLKTPTYLHVTFAPGMDYAQAVTTVSDLGFRLADPCYEQTKPAPAWHAMGQETSYATSDSLTLALTDANATLWRGQLAKTPGVTGYSVLAGNGCAA